MTDDNLHCPFCKRDLYPASPLAALTAGPPQSLVNAGEHGLCHIGCAIEYLFRDKGSDEESKVGSPIRYAENLAIALHKKHYAGESPLWNPKLGDLLGLLIQIDNMTSGLERPKEEVKESPHAENIARVCHDANRGYCVTIGDPVLEQWEFIAEEIKKSMIASVVRVLDDPSRTPSGGLTEEEQIKDKLFIAIVKALM